MIPLNQIDIDRLLAIAHADLVEAITGWVGGQPRDETAFMNRITERLSRRRRGCDIGERTPVHVVATTYLLHRKGEKLVDRYGADLALTVRSPSHSYVKTAFFQIKRSYDYDTIIEARQIADGRHDHKVAERSFVLAVDERKKSIRFRPLVDFTKEIPKTQQRKKYDCAPWQGFFEWIQDWLSCKSGKTSLPSDDPPVEDMLRKYIVEPEGPQRVLPLSDETRPEGFIPAKAWLELKLTGGADA